MPDTLTGWGVKDPKGRSFGYVVCGGSMDAFGWCVRCGERILSTARFCQRLVPARRVELREVSANPDRSEPLTGWGVRGPEGLLRWEPFETQDEAERELFLALRGSPADGRDYRVVRVEQREVPE